jgi:hypothetical protein
LALAAGAAVAAGAAGVAAGRGAPKPLRCTRQHSPARWAHDRGMLTWVPAGPSP